MSFNTLSSDLKASSNFFFSEIHRRLDHNPPCPISVFSADFKILKFLNSKVCTRKITTYAGWREIVGCPTSVSRDFSCNLGTLEYHMKKISPVFKATEHFWWFPRRFLNNFHLFCPLILPLILSNFENFAFLEFFSDCFQCKIAWEKFWKFISNFVFFVWSGIVIHGHLTKNHEDFQISCHLLPASKGFSKIDSHLIPLLSGRQNHQNIQNFYFLENFDFFWSIWIFSGC